jgi:polysaccharide biosynthesis transport protein
MGLVPAAPDTGVRFRDYVEIAARRKWVAVGVFIGVLGLTVLFIIRTRPVFQASATMMLTTSTGSDVFGVQGSQKGSAAGQLKTDDDISNNIRLVQSGSMYAKVAERLPDARMLYSSTVSAQAMKDARGFILTVSASAPATAVTVANTYVEAYQEYADELSRANATAVRKFIEEQLAVAGTRLDSFERNLAQFKKTHQLTEIGSGAVALTNRQLGLAAQYEQTVIDVEANQTQLAHVQSQIEQAGKGLTDKLGGISSPLVANLQAAMNQLEVEKTNLIIRGFDGNSERIKGLDRQIDSTRSRLIIESQALVAQQGFAGPVGGLSELFASSLTLSTALATAKARQEALANAMSENRVPIARLPEAERVLAGLTRDVTTGQTVYSLLSQRYEEARIQEVAQKSPVQIMDRARGAYQTKPNVRTSLSFGLLLALALAFGSVYAAERIDTSVHGPSGLVRHGFSILGSIPRLSTAGRRWRWGRREDVTSHLITHTDPDSSGSEAFRMLRTNLSYAGIERQVRTIAVTSPGPNEGKSTIAVNLASVLAQAGSRVLLVDADMRHPKLHTVFNRSKKPGLSDLIVLKSDPAQAILPTGLDGLFLLPCGTMPPSPSDVLALTATRALLERLASEYDYVVIDTPPVLVGADSPVVGALADATIMVVRDGRTASEAIGYASTTLLAGGAHLSGFVLNEAKNSGRYYYYDKYHRHYSKRGEEETKPSGGEPGTGNGGSETADS